MASYGDIDKLAPGQKKVIRKIIEVGQKRGKEARLSPRETRKMINTNLAVGYTESRYSNPSGGDRDSAGYRQERAMYYDNPTNLGAAVNRFYDEYLADADRSAPLGVRAQQVQQSGTPHVWDSLAPMANQIRRQFSDGQSARFRPDGGGSRLVGELTTVPGVDNSAAREQLKLQTLTAALGQNRMPSQTELLGLASGLKEMPDTPDSTELGLKRVRTNDRSGGVRAGRSGGGGDVMDMLRKAVAWDKAKVPYLWGGGHGSIAKPGQPVDCSGYVSSVLGLDTPQVSGNFASWGKPGKGRNVTVYANSGHVLMSIRDPRTKKVRWFGTSRSMHLDGRTNGGAGELKPPPASYLANFTARHPT